MCEHALQDSLSAYKTFKATLIAWLANVSSE